MLRLRFMLTELLIALNAKWKKLRKLAKNYLFLKARLFAPIDFPDEFQLKKINFIVCLLPVVSCIHLGAIHTVKGTLRRKAWISKDTRTKNYTATSFQKETKLHGAKGWIVAEFNFIPCRCLWVFVEDDTWRVRTNSGHVFCARSMLFPNTAPNSIPHIALKKNVRFNFSLKIHLFALDLPPKGTQKLFGFSFGFFGLKRLSVVARKRKCAKNRLR